MSIPLEIDEFVMFSGIIILETLRKYNISEAHLRINSSDFLDTANYCREDIEYIHLLSTKFNETPNKYKELFIDKATMVSIALAGSAAVNKDACPEAIKVATLSSEKDWTEALTKCEELTADDADHNTRRNWRG